MNTLKLPFPSSDPPSLAVPGVRAQGWQWQTRSQVLSTQGMVATSQPLAAQAGLRILKARGNAVDAAVATAAMLSVVEPMMVGPAADLFAVIYVAKEDRIYVLNANGRSPAGMTLDFMHSQGYKADPANYGPGSGMPSFGILTVPVPGAVWGWHEVLRRFGSMNFKQVLQPAVDYARRGFPVSERIAFDWKNMPSGLGDASSCCKSVDPDSVATWYINGKPPVEGEVFCNPYLARTFKLLQKRGPDEFYKGEIAQAIVAKSKALGGVITMDDLANYKGEWVEPLTTEFLGWTFNEAPPPSQGWAGQLMLNILMACHKQVYPGESLDSLAPTDPRYWHLLIEAKKLAYADLFKYTGDPNTNPGLIERIKALLTIEHAENLGQKIQPDKALAPVQPPADFSDFGDTIVLTTADRDGNQVAWVNSLYWYFGSGLTVRPYGVTLGNRGALFSLDATSPNVIAPNKRPFTTICAAFVAQKAGGNLAKRFSLLLMGGGMQAQGHGQLMTNLWLGANMQQAIDMARFYHDQVPNVVQLEAPIYDIVGEKLKKMGHDVVRSNSAMTGGAQMIMSMPQKTADGTGITRRGRLQRVLVGASDPRKDGQAVGY